MVVLDNFLSNFDDLYNLVTDRDSSWKFLQHMTDPLGADVDQGFQRNLPKILCRSIVDQVNAALDLNLKKIDLARANCKFPNTVTETTRWFHVDQMQPHTVILIYLTKSNAPTRLTDVYWQPGMDQLQQDLEVSDLVYPEPNRVLVFDGLRYHSDSVPTDTCRINVNLNAYEKESN